MKTMLWFLKELVQTAQWFSVSVMTQGNIGFGESTCTRSTDEDQLNTKMHKKID